MIGIDTNVLLRLFTDDSPPQVAAAKAFFDRQPGASIRVSCIVLTELVWTLRRHYKLSKPLIIEAVKAMLSRRELVIEGRAEVLEALRFYEYGGADFGDYFIGLLNRANGAHPTYTFDRDAAGNESLFRSIEP